MRIASSGRTFYDDGYSDGEDDEKQGLDNALSFPKNRLYGRSKELKQLRELYDSLETAENQETTGQTGPPFVVVTGYPGSGKSSLIRNFARGLKQELKMDKANATPFFFVAGKYSSSNRRQDHPFSAIVQAFDALFRQIIRDNDPSELQGIRRSIQSVIGGEDLHALTPLIPGLAAFMERDGLNPQDDNTDEILGGASRDCAWNQVKYLFQSLLRAISSPETGRRIILFLDNLDLADESSLDLLSIFVRDRSLRRIMIVCSIQSMPGSHHAAKDMLTELEDTTKQPQNGNKSIITKLDVGNLNLEDLNQFVGDTLELEPDKTMPLSKIIYNQTKGNMFFAVNFMQEMHRKNVLYFSVIAFMWEWNLEAAGELEAELSNDMLDVIAKRIKEEMSQRMQRALTIASYTRSVLSSTTLFSLMQKEDESLTQAEFDAMLEEAIKEGYFQRLYYRRRTKKKKDDDNDDNGDNGGGRIAHVRFAHGQIQQAAMTLIEHGSERDKMKRFIALHLKDLWNDNNKKQKPASAEDNWMLYTAADFLNSIPSEPEHYACLANLNLTCGEIALEIGAFKPASFYLRKGLRALEKTNKPWTSHYDLTLSLLRMNAKAELFLGNYELSSSLSLQILKHCKTVEEKKPTYLTMSLAKSDQGKYEESVQILMSALEIFTDFPKRFLTLHVVSEIRKVKKYFDSHTNDFFLLLPDMESPQMTSNMELLQVTAHRAFFLQNTVVFLLCSLRMIRLSIQYGIDGRTASALAGYAVYLSSMGDQNGAIRMGRLVRQLLERGGGPRKSGSRAIYMVTVWVETWTTPIETIMNSLHRSHKLGMEAGDLEIAFVVRMSLFRFVFHGGYPLDAVRKYGQEIVDEFALLKTESNRRVMEDFLLPIEYLFRKGNIVTWDALAMPEVDPTDKDKQFLLFYFTLTRLMIAVFFGNLQYAKELADQLADRQRDDSVHLNLLNRITFSSLVYSRLARKTKTQRKKNIARARRCAGRLRKLVYSKGTTPLFLLKLMDADILASTSDSLDEVQGHYDTAIASALDSGHIQFAALGSELAGEYFYNAAKEGLAEKYINDACALYKEWRAFAKVAHLVQQYPSILSLENQKSVEFTNLVGEVGMYQRRKSGDLDRLSTSIPTDVPFRTPELMAAEPSVNNDA
eukprot:CAMPEP_0113607948 /NCGR_PEP_ID=MMETSP0017_2-20120614/3659_1 /TAXON_ID=2856 /ORGANISM="Cylindrotheca closterium" /LENGTH=1147 /DNA_ID=CAMNT_0000516591 /DNA_START=255 /DNA_END=3698 /DNA_ORIENTATION=- /assembly_acc=CAM_ASM_000147